MTDAALLPDASYLVLASRLIPDLDGGFTISVLRRARDMAHAGADPVLLTIDPGETADHDAHRAEWVRRGLLAESAGLRNLFDDARADAAWLRAAALPLPAPETDNDTRAITAADGRTVLELPVIAGDPAWHLSTAAVLVWEADGSAPAGWLPGFGGLYRAWVGAVAAERGLPALVVCEARQVGELLVAGDTDRSASPSLDSAIRILHTTHACHVLAPFRWDSPMDAAWTRWLDVADRFDGVLWLTPTQRDDVERRLAAPTADADTAHETEGAGRGIRSFVVPHPAPEPDAAPSARTVPGRIVMLNSLIARKRVDHAIRALAAVRDAVPDAHLHVYGDGAARPALEAQASELGVADAVEFRGHTADTTDAWATADVFVLASTNEGQPLVVLEALGHGVPVVSYDMPYGPRDTLALGGGVLAEDGDVDALATALAAVLGDRELRAELSAEGRAAASVMTPAASMAALADAAHAALAG